MSAPYSFLVFIHHNQWKFAGAAICILLFAALMELIKQNTNKNVRRKPETKMLQTRSRSSISQPMHHTYEPPIIPIATTKEKQYQPIKQKMHALEPIMEHKEQSEVASPVKSSQPTEVKKYKISKVMYSMPRNRQKQKREAIKMIKSIKPLAKSDKNQDKDELIEEKEEINALIFNHAPKRKLDIDKKNNNDIKELQKELDLTCYPDYLDGYSSLSKDQKTFLSAIKIGDFDKVKHMVKHNELIREDINFGESQVLRECTLSHRLEILRFLKDAFLHKLDLNIENGYCLRWAARKGFMDIIKYLLFEQKYQKIDIAHFQYQAIEWSIVYSNSKIAKILQKYYIDYKLSNKWDALSLSHPSCHDLGVEFDIFNLPSIYQEIIELIIHCDNSDNGNNNLYDANVAIIRKYYENGCDLQFENNMAWTVAVDCTNLSVLRFLVKTIGINPCIQNNYLLRTSCEIQSIEMLQFAKTVISLKEWQRKIEPNIEEYKALCDDNEGIIEELMNYDSAKDVIEIPQTPMPHKYVQKKYGLITRSKRV